MSPIEERANEVPAEESGGPSDEIAAHGAVVVGGRGSVQWSQPPLRCAKVPRIVPRSPRPRRFSYYARLSPEDKAIYRQSDAIASIDVPDVAALQPLVAALEEALAVGKRVRVASAAVALSDALLRQLGAPPVKIHVREVRPRFEAGELHGLYTFAQGGKVPKLEVWMRTAAHAKTVKFRTFLRTLLHELLHHLDVTVLGLGESFHTEGFFRRESSLVRQLAGTRPKPPPLPKKEQLTLF